MEPMTLEEIHRLCDESTFRSARRIVADGAVQDTARTDTALFARVTGTQPYAVTIRLSEGKVTARCTCPAARSRPFCKHAVAVLILWVESPERFVRGEDPSQRAASAPTQRVRREKIDRTTLQVQSIDQTIRLTLYLARVGILNVSQEHIAQLLQISENLFAMKTRRLAQSVQQIATMLRSAHEAGAPVMEDAYVELLARLWLTARALQEHFAGRRPLPEQQLEEMLGHTWRDKDLEILEDVRLAELAYETLITPTGFRIEISHMIDLDRGTLYREMRIVPLHVPQATAEPKPSWPEPLRAERIGIYPGYAPRRIKLFSPQPLQRPPDWVVALSPHAIRSMHALRQIAQDHLADPFAPPSLTALVAPAQYVWWQGQAWLADETGDLLRLLIRPFPERIQRTESWEDPIEKYWKTGDLSASYEDPWPSEHAMIMKELPLLFGYLRVVDGEWGFLPLSGITADGPEPLRHGVYRM